MLVALVGVVIGLGGVAFATIPDSGGTIHGCYSKSNGNLRVVESASDCRNNETALPWNQQGPPGPPGGGIVAKARSTAPVAPPGSDSLPIPLSGATWTQRAGEINDFYGELTYTKIEGPCFQNPSGALTVKADGQRVLFHTYGQSLPDGTYTETIRPFGSEERKNDFFFESGSAATHTLTAEARQDFCNLGPRFRIDSLKVDVVAFR
jgi:hypothetical protein